MSLVINSDGWLELPTVSHGGAKKIRIIPARARHNAQGEKFKPGGQPLAQYVMKRYGGPRCVWVHGTDVVPRSLDKMANRTAYSSQRASGYHFLLGSGLIYQFYPVIVQAWGAGRRLEKVMELAEQGNEKAARMLTTNYGKWAWANPVIDGRVIGNPNAWGPHIELVSWQRLTKVRKSDGYGLVRRKVKGKMKTIAVLPPSQFSLVLNEETGKYEPWHHFDPRDLANLELLLRALYAGPGAIDPDGVLRHSTVGVNRIDPGPLCLVEDIAEAAGEDALALKDGDESNEGDDEDAYQEAYEGPAQHD